MMYVIIISYERWYDYMFTYKPLLKTLIDRNMSLSDLANATGLSSAIIAKVNKNENMTMGSLDKICSVLDCDIDEVIAYVKMDRIVPPEDYLLVRDVPVREKHIDDDSVQVED